MSPTPVSPVPPSSRRSRVRVVLLGLFVLLGAAVFAITVWPLPLLRAEAASSAPQESEQPEAKKSDDADDHRIKAPELEGGVAWLNTAGPLRIKDLKGKVVVLDFWTFCCINCIHTLPDLAKLEKKYAKELVVIGVHSAKFENEKVTENIRKAILRYEISHPVVNDAHMKIWRTYEANSWPTLYLIDPEGYIVARGSGEGLHEGLDRAIAKVIEIHKAKKTLDEKPRRFELARFSEKGDSPLFFPGKVLADAASKRLFIADSTHHRIVITDLDGKKIAIAGDGEPGWKDGAFDKAQFSDPQGMALKGETLYVADRKNHLIRALDLKARTVITVAGTGSQGEDRRRGGLAFGKSMQVVALLAGPSFVGPQSFASMIGTRATILAFGLVATGAGLNSPWDLFLCGDTLYMALAGHHQIWAFDLMKEEVHPYAGNGAERVVDGAFERSSFAQPSGLTSDGNVLYVADSEGSVIRSVGLGGKGEVQTFIGYECRENLFDAGDTDGVGEEVRLQHALGVAFHDGKLYVADTYNSKIKVVDPAKRSCTTLLGGERDGWLAGPLFNEPGGLSVAGDKLYVADTNAHRIRVVDLKNRTVSTLKLQGVEAPKLKTP